MLFQQCDVKMQSYNLEMNRRPAKRREPQMPIRRDYIPEPRTQVPVHVTDPVAERPAILDAHCREALLSSRILFSRLSNRQFGRGRSLLKPGRGQAVRLKEVTIGVFVYNRK